MRHYSIKTWLTRGTYPRLFLPILAIIVAVTLVRYHLMFSAELQEAIEHQRAQVQVTGHYLLPLLVRASANGTHAELQAMLEAELGFNPEIQSLQWSQRGTVLQAGTSGFAHAQVPLWFEQFAALKPLSGDFAQQLPDGTNVQLVVVVGNVQVLEQVWRTIGAQMHISAMNIFTILFLLTLLLRANARMLSRLNTATEAFRAGALHARMAEKGTLEMRAVAQAFNSMAEQIQGLVQSLQTTQAELEEQLHFTRQLINALPLPVFVRGTDGTCLGVNQAWETFFNTPAQAVVGVPLSSDFVALPHERAGRERRVLSRKDNEVLVKAGTYDLREMVYFKAPFTLTDGSVGGSIGALVDITERKLAQEALLEEKERAVVTLSSIADGVITTDLHGHIDSLNEAAQFLTGYTEQQALGRRLSEVFQLDTKSQALPQGVRVDQLHQTQTAVHAINQLLLHHSGERYAIEFTAAPIRQSHGTARGCVLVFRDVTETRDLQQKISWQARHDALTGLNNRDALAERLTHALYQARQDGGMLSVCLLDLDHFQDINDRHGNWAGDRLLKEVALRLQGFVQDPADAARLGGDEFVVLLRGPSGEAEVQSRTLALLECLAQPYAIDDLLIHSSASAGVVLFPQDNASPDTLLRHADQAMYQAKQAGRGFHIFDAQQDQEVQTHYTQLARLAIAVHQGEFRLHYQPKVHMRTGEIVGVEALLRWQHPEQGLLAPGGFLPLMEHTDLVVETGEWVLHQALAQLQTWVSQGQRWVVSVNIAARHFHRADFVDRLRALLACYPQAPAHLLELEILESAVLQDIQHMRQVMQGCQALGVCFALDDFGTGFSSLSYLKRLPAETIKIDRMFVEGLLDDPEDRTLVGAIVALAKAFDRAVIAEGVETSAQASKLLELGCELGQGYGIARPMPAADMLPWAARRSTNRAEA
ncbi:EAL domain-containing protein [Rhodoferax saidenbachensis]|uniref:Diguanylate cyclase (GGDEF)-like protein/PAS domain S-box-containing protein n=1 Tax=Rhodoferax saidenbachensis TaxID=1484693 RepID=A0ABU1ZI46_9BURK|nr:EAL domain-containing protein [Rhodoferax saidenbachensis]MDR7305203.1 diguanylate cyclase (GGDEF)-like protein/PAS domain S-box-containing protein [Rhodoferax saidenbachensis]